MDQYYIRRGEQQYGPYLSQQMLEMQAAGQLFVDDVIFDAAANRAMSVEEAARKWRAAAAAAQQPHRPRRRRPVRRLVIWGILLLGVAGAIVYGAATKKSDNLTLGRRTQAVSASLPVEGGVVSVMAPDSPVSGMSITVSPRSYEGDTAFRVSTREIKANRFGELFTPITPLITVDNDHRFSATPITVTIPIQKSDDEFAMGFYYDEKTGKLEGIPTASLDNSQITLVLSHFSDVVVAKAPTSSLQGVTVDTGFRPGTDDWQFVNIGSWLAPGGFCAGESISAMWYYSEVRAKLNEPHLFGRFDNNRYGLKSPTYWWDDSDGIRFASMVQHNVNWDAISRDVSKFLGGYSPSLTMNAFAYAMALTKEPQYVSITRDYVDQDGKPRTGGHAIVAYKIEDNKIYVSDPNMPGKADRYISAGPGGFSPYSSGANSTQIQAAGEVLYPSIFYMAKSALIDYSVMDKLYRQLREGTVGNDLFPKCEIKLMTAYDPVTGTGTWESCPDVIKTDAIKTAKVDPKYRGKLVFSVVSAYSDQITMAIKGLDNPVALETRTPATPGGVVFTVSLDEGINDLGFYTTFQSGGEDAYSEFRRVKVEYEQNDALEFEKSSYSGFLEKKIKFAVKTDAAPAAVKYIWNFGSGEAQLETAEPEIEYAYATEGDNVVTCSMVDTGQGKILATARVPITLRDLYGVWSFDLTIQKSGPVDSLINAISNFLIGIINSAVPDLNIPPANISIAGTVIGCELTVQKPADGDTSDRVQVVLQEKTSSTDYVDVVEEPINGYLTVDEKGNTKIVLTGSDNGENGGLVFKGILDGGQMSGTFDAAAIMSGDFRAFKT